MYCALAQGNIRLWDLAKVQERSLLESSRSCSPRPGHEDLRLSSETEEEPSPRHGRATISAKYELIPYVTNNGVEAVAEYFCLRIPMHTTKLWALQCISLLSRFRRGVMANRRRTFLTQPTPEWPSETDDEHHDLSAMRKRRDGTKGRNVRAFMVTQAHSSRCFQLCK